MLFKFIFYTTRLRHSIRPTTLMCCYFLLYRLLSLLFEKHSNWIVEKESFKAGLSNAWPAVWPVLRLKLLKNYMEVRISMQLQNYIAVISVANRGSNSLGQPKHVYSSARAFSKYWRSEPVPKPLPRACPKGQKPRPHRHLPPSTLYICLKIQDGYIPQS